MFYIYILYSPSADKFYVGYSTDPIRRLVEHNSTPHDTYTSKH
ncbi:MAG: GIY-YIG nuclease family protein, partial [Sphingobacteriales bacterium]